MKLLYLKTSSHDNAVDSGSANLTEVGQKAIERGDFTLTVETVNALQQLAIDSIEIRKSALTYMTVDIMVVKSNAETQLERIYENLLAINRSAE